MVQSNHMQHPTTRVAQQVLANPSSLCQRLNVPHVQPVSNRRQFLTQSGAGFGALALNGMLAEADIIENGIATPGCHHPARAKSVIFLFMEGGPSQLDTFDRKPLLNDSGRSSRYPPLFANRSRPWARRVHLCLRANASGIVTAKAGLKSVTGFRMSRNMPTSWPS